jgi:hypothetical protein
MYKFNELAIPNNITRTWGFDYPKCLL